MFDKIVEQCKKYDNYINRILKKECDFGQKLQRDFMWDLKLIDSFEIDVYGRAEFPEIDIVQRAWHNEVFEPYKFEFRAPDAAGNMWKVNVNVSARLVLKVRPHLASEIQQWVCAKLQNTKYMKEYDMEFHRKSIHC